MEKIIYEDDELRVIYSARSSKELVITFGNLNNLAEGMDYFGKKPLAKLNYASIGFMSKHCSWFPQSNMLQCIAAIQKWLQPYDKKVVYGGSMGGYAAVKYSRALGADFVLSMCPQWSIDPSECDGWNPGWQEHFTPSMRNMGIRPQDIGGKVYVFCDFHHPLDKKHAFLIAQQDPCVRLINVPFSKHHVTTVLAGTANLQALVRACLHNDELLLHQTNRLARRKSDFSIKNALKASANKTPNHFLAYMSKKENRYLFKKKPVFIALYLQSLLRKKVF